MRSLHKILLVSGTTLFFAGTALAADTGIAIRNLPDKGAVTVSGTVEQVKNEREFTLRDTSGAVDVKLASDQSAVLKQGDNVTVTGAMETPWWGLAGKDIAASNVRVHKDLGTALSDAVTKTTGITMDKAEVVRIGALPAEGEVRITGVVDQVGNEKNFTVKDATGKVDVSMRSDESVVLAKGAEVTVVGYVKSGMLGKKVDATHVIVLSDVAPAAGPSAGPVATK